MEGFSVMKFYSLVIISYLKEARELSVRVGKLNSASNTDHLHFGAT